MLVEVRGGSAGCEEGEDSGSKGVSELHDNCLCNKERLNVS